MTAAHSSARVHAHDETPVFMERVSPEAWVSRFLDGDGLSVLDLYLSAGVARRHRNQLSVALGDNGAARIAGVRDGAVVWVDDNGQHQILLDELAELDDCALCDLPATTSNDRREAVCLAHA